jgi:uncharacterized membrane protein
VTHSTTVSLVLGSGALAAAEGMIRYVAGGSVRPSRARWIHVIGNLLALLLSASNLIYRLNEDATKAVLPTGITLTAIVVCLLMVTAYLGRGLVSDASIDEADDWDVL